MDQGVADYIKNIDQPWKAEICTRLRQMIHQSIPDVAERIQYGKPHFLHHGAYAFVLAAAKGWVSFTIFNAATLDAPEGLFEPGGADRKTVKIHQGQPIDYELLAKLIHDASRSQADGPAGVTSEGR